MITTYIFLNFRKEKNINIVITLPLSTKLRSKVNILLCNTLFYKVEQYFGCKYKTYYDVVKRFPFKYLTLYSTSLTLSIRQQKPSH